MIVEQLRQQVVLEQLIEVNQTSKAGKATKAVKSTKAVKAHNITYLKSTMLVIVVEEKKGEWALFYTDR